MIGQSKRKSGVFQVELLEMTIYLFLFQGQKRKEDIIYTHMSLVPKKFSGDLWNRLIIRLLMWGKNETEKGI